MRQERAYLTGPRRKGGWPHTMRPAKLRLAQAAMVERDAKVGGLCKELRVPRQTLYCSDGRNGEVRPGGAKLLERKRQQTSS
jgi:hypothetical protein